MAEHFDPTSAPFDRLTPAEIGVVRASLDIGYYRPGETILERGGAPDGLFVVLKGSVEERDGDELISLRGPGDAFDSRALVQGSGSNAFVAREETLCNLLPRDVTLQLINVNPRFAAFFYLEVSRKLDAASTAEEEARFAPLLNARVRDLDWHPAVFVEPDTAVRDAAATMRSRCVYAVFLRQPEGIAILTRSDLLDALIEGRAADAPVTPLAHHPVVSISSGDFVATALLKMTRHNKRRVAVVENGAFVGVLEDIDLISFLAGNSQLVAGRIDRAGSIDELAAAARKIEPQLRILRRQGVKVETVCEIVSDLNRHLLARLYALIAPPSFRDDASLIVMGSEGRGEQTFRTDQDNGLILAAPARESDVAAFRLAFSEALEGFGFPPCPGGVMVRNPQWSQPLEAYRADVRRWLALGDEAGMMNIAILFDAEAVAGNPAPLRQAKLELIEAMRGEPVHLARFARAIDAFPTPIGFFNNLVTSKETGDALDLKKGGIFPVVHGVRSLALEAGLFETNTAARIGRLADAGVLAADFARELTQSLHYLMTLRLDAQMAESSAASLVRPRELSSLDRDLLRDAFQVVKRLRDIVRRRFNLMLF